MKRLLLNLLTPLSLLLCLAVVGLWVRSHRVAHWGRLLRIPEVSTARGGRPVTTETRASADLGRLSVLTMWGPRETDWAYVIATAGGKRRVNWWSWGTQDPSDKLLRQASQNPPSLWNRIGFAYEYVERPPQRNTRVLLVVAPLWTVAVALAAPPAGRAYGWLRRRRRRGSNLCPTCGYDLRATPERCPECGTQGSSVGSRNR